MEVTIEAARPKHRYVALDSLRGVCACMVVLQHFETQGQISALPLVRHGFLFVDFFFVLSGFVIGSGYGDRLAEGLPVGRFMRLRLGRIYPLHFAVLMAYLAFEVAFALFMPGLAERRPFEGDYSPVTLLYGLSLVQIFLGPEATPWNGPSWSIAAEMWTYLIFALLLRHAFRLTVPVCLLVALVAPVVLAGLTDRNIAVIHEGALLRCMFGFALGILGWRLSDAAARISVPARGDTLLELAVVAAIVGLVSVAGAGPLSLAAPFLFLLAVLVFARERGAASGLLRRAPFILVGTLSYSIYMVHMFLQYRFVNMLKLAERSTGEALVATVDGHSVVGGGALFGDMMSIAFLGIVVACAYVSYRLVELPGQRLARGRIGHGAHPAAPAASGVS